MPEFSRDLPSGGASCTCWDNERRFPLALLICVYQLVRLTRNIFRLGERKVSRATSTFTSTGASLPFFISEARRSATNGPLYFSRDSLALLLSRLNLPIPPLISFFTFFTNSRSLTYTKTHSSRYYIFCPIISDDQTPGFSSFSLKLRWRLASLVTDQWGKTCKIGRLARGASYLARKISNRERKINIQLEKFDTLALIRRDVASTLPRLRLTELGRSDVKLAQVDPGLVVLHIESHKTPRQHRIRLLCSFEFDDPFEIPSADMVAFPDSGIEPTLLNEESLNEKNSSEFKEVLPELIDSYKMRDEPFTISRILLKSEKDSFSLDIACIQDMKIDSPTDDIKTDANVVKKVAAGLKTPNGQKKKEEMSISGFGGGSLSSGSSIITISSVTNSDPDPEFIKSPNDKKPENTERWYHTTLQVAVPFFIAGIGTIGAGLVLDEVMNWPVYKAVSQLFILIPSLLGLKGNLDMCLASRLSTQANLGNMQGLREISKMVIGNLALVQIQATVAAILVAIFAMTIGAISNGSFEWKYAMLLISASVCTATSSCFILDFVMIAVIMISHRCKMNPDNLATPLAASVGDVVSTSVLSAVASQLFLRLDNEMWTLYVIMLGYLLLLPFWIYVVLHNHYTRNVLTSGWVPVLSALFISGFGGLILGKVVNLFFGFVIFQPIINGIGGNLVSVQASRISTMLHKSSIMGIVPPHIKILVSPWKALFKGVPYAKTARILIAMAIPGHLVFVFAADYIKWGHRTLQPYFVVSYILVSVMQVMILLYIAHIMIHAMWKYKIDPDNSAIPYLTALGDLIGSILLALAFWFLKAIHREYGPE